eukprot:414279_1
MSKFFVNMADWQECIDLMVDVNNERPIFIAARKYYSSQQWKKAEIEYKKLLRINPNNPEYNNSYSSILLRINTNVKSRKKSLKYSTIAIQQSPHHVKYRLNKINNLIQLNMSHHKLQKEFKIIFQLLFSTPIESCKCCNNDDLVFEALTTYSDAIFWHDVYEMEAIKYLEYAISTLSMDQINRNPQVQMAFQNLANYYIEMDLLENAVKCIKMYNVESKYPKLHNLDCDYPDTWNYEMGSLYLRLHKFPIAYKCLKYVYNQENTSHSLSIYVRLMRCCIELGKYVEARSLYREAEHLVKIHPSIFSLSINNGLEYRQRLMYLYLLIKQGDTTRIWRAIRDLNKMLNFHLTHMRKFGYDIAPIHYYLALAYKALKHPKYADKIKEMLFHSVHLKFPETVYFWEFALILFKEKEYLLCKKYMNMSWKRNKQIECICMQYPRLKPILKKIIATLNCRYCHRKNVKVKLKACKGCHAVFYCNKKCQKKDWRKRHRKNCSKFWIKMEKQKLKSTIKKFSYTTLTDLQNGYPLYFNSKC